MGKEGILTRRVMQKASAVQSYVLEGAQAGLV